MNIPALLIEYLITGGFACLWILPLVWEVIPESVINKPFIALFGIPFLYVIGLMLDMISSFIANKAGWKKKIRESEQTVFTEIYGEVKNEIFATQIIRYKSPELANEFEKRSSRDRIARGAVINFLLASIIIPLSSLKSTSVNTAVLYFFIVFSICLICFQIWKVCERRSYRFKLRSMYILDDEKNSSNDTGE